MHFNEFILWSS